MLKIGTILHIHYTFTLMTLKSYYYKKCLIQLYTNFIFLINDCIFILPLIIMYQLTGLPVSLQQLREKH